MGLYIILYLHKDVYAQNSHNRVILYILFHLYITFSRRGKYGCQKKEGGIFFYAQYRPPGIDRKIRYFTCDVSCRYSDKDTAPTYTVKLQKFQDY